LVLTAWWLAVVVSAAREKSVGRSALILRLAIAGWRSRYVLDAVD